MRRSIRGPEVVHEHACAARDVAQGADAEIREHGMGLPSARGEPRTVISVPLTGPVCLVGPGQPAFCPPKLRVPSA